MERPLRVLVVDDCPDTRESLHILLHLWGHDSAEAADGPAALELAAAFRPDAFVLDVGMPGMSGYDVARRLRRLPALEDVLLIAATGFGQARDLAASRAAGFDYHLVKPFDPAQLERLLACRPFRIGARARTYLPQRLDAASYEDLAGRVRAFDEGQMEALWGRLRRRHGGG
jgi:CheY-like chemotaxis protein